MTNDQLIAAFKEINKDFTELLLNKKDLFRDIPFSSPNFKDLKYIPFIKKIDEQINQLPFDSRTIDQLNGLKKYANYNKEKLKSQISQKSEVRCQIELINLFEKDIDSIINQILIESEEEESKSDTELTRDETALLILYLQKVKLIANNISDVQAAKAFSSLSGFSENHLRKKITGEMKLNKFMVSDKKSSYDQLLARFNKIIDLLTEDKKAVKD